MKRRNRKRVRAFGAAAAGVAAVASVVALARLRPANEIPVSLSRVPSRPVMPRAATQPANEIRPDPSHNLFPDPREISENSILRATKMPPGYGWQSKPSVSNLWANLSHRNNDLHRLNPVTMSMADFRKHHAIVHSG